MKEALAGRKELMELLSRSNKYLEGDIFADAGPSLFGSRKVIRYIDDSFIIVRRSLRVRNVN